MLRPSRSQRPLSAFLLVLVLGCPAMAQEQVRVRLQDDLGGEHQFETGHAYLSVLQTFRFVAESVAEVHVRGGGFEATPTHPVFDLESGRFLPARELRSGTRLSEVDSKDVVVDEVLVAPRTATVHDLEVEVAHNYHITLANGSRILVHNSGGRLLDGDSTIPSAYARARGPAPADLQVWRQGEIGTLDDSVHLFVVDGDGALRVARKRPDLGSMSPRERRWAERRGTAETHHDQLVGNAPVRLGGEIRFEGRRFWVNDDSGAYSAGLGRVESGRRLSRLVRELEAAGFEHAGRL